MDRPVSMRKVAELVGVSVATVSRVLNNKPGVSEATRSRVVAAMEEYDYTPSVILNRGQTIGIVIFPETNVFLADFFPELLHGISEETFKREHQLILIRASKPELNERDLRHRMRSLGLCGYIILGSFLTERDILPLVGIDVPYVIVGGAAIPRKANWVGYDHISAAKEMTRYVLSMGHTRVAAVGWPKERASNAAHLRGIREELAAAGLSLVGGSAVPPIETQCEQLLTSRSASEAPPAIITLSHSDGLFVSSVATRLGMRIPEELSVVTFGDYRSSQWLDTKLTTAPLPSESIGSKAISLLLELASGQIAQPVRHEFSAHLILRNSVRRI